MAESLSCTLILTKLELRNCSFVCSRFPYFHCRLCGLRLLSICFVDKTILHFNCLDMDKQKIYNGVYCSRKLSTITSYFYYSFPPPVEKRAPNYTTIIYSECTTRRILYLLSVRWLPESFFTTIELWTTLTDCI